MSRLIALAFLICLTSPIVVTARAADILVLGDSWGVGINDSIVAVAGSEGFTVNNQAHGGRTAADMVTPSGLVELTGDLLANPDAKVVQLIIGGNDFLNRTSGWNSSLTTAAEQALFDSIIDDVETIADHIATIRPDVETFHMGYEYPQPLPLGSVQEVNQAILTLSAMQESIVAPNYNYIEFYGLTQKAFGFNGNPPDGTSDPNFPGAAIAFRDNIHLTQAGYLLYAQASFDTYRSVLVPEPTSATSLFLAAVGLIRLRRRR